MNTVVEDISAVSPIGAASGQPETRSPSAATALAGVSAVLLTACGGGGDDEAAVAEVAGAGAQVGDGASQGLEADHLLPADSAAAMPDQGSVVQSPAREVQAKAVAAISRQDAARFLQQAGFGGNASAVDAVISRGFAGWIDWQSGLARSTDRYTLLAPLSEDGRAPRHFRRVDDVLWRKLMTGADVLRQRVTLALSEIFVVSMEDSQYSWCGAAVADYMDRLEACALGTPGQPVTANGPGTYRHLLEKVTLSHAMGRYLSMFGSQKADGRGSSPDENYAREVLQLFSIGLHQLKSNGQPKLDPSGQRIDTYKSADVTALARVFTGWHWNGFSATNPAFIRRDMGVRANQHDTGNKTMPTLGWSIQGNASAAVEMQAALDRIAGHPNVGPFIGRQLIQRLITSNPSPAYVARIARVFNDNGTGVRGDLRTVVKAILLDAEARTVSTSPRGGRLTPPMNRLVQWARTFGATSTSGQWTIGDLSNASQSLGQSPLRSPSVFNFYRPGYVHPGTPGSVTAGMGTAGLTVPEFQITNEVSVLGYANHMQAVILGRRRWINSNGRERFTELDVKARYTEWLPMADRPDRLFDELNVLLAAGRVGAATRALIVGAVTAMPAAVNDEARAHRVGAMIWLIMCSPQYLVQK